MSQAFTIAGHHVHPGMTLRDALRIAYLLGCSVSPVKGTDDIKIRLPDGGPTFRTNVTKRDAGKSLLGFLRKTERTSEKGETVMSFAPESIRAQVGRAFLDLYFNSGAPLDHEPVALRSGLTTKQAMDCLHHLAREGFVRKVSGEKGGRLRWLPIKEKLVPMIPGYEIPKQEKGVAVAAPAETKPAETKPAVTRPATPPREASPPPPPPAPVERGSIEELLPKEDPGSAADLIRKAVSLMEESLVCLKKAADMVDAGQVIDEEQASAIALLVEAAQKRRA
jgi:hypothetical protein